LIPADVPAAGDDGDAAVPPADPDLADVTDLAPAGRRNPAEVGR
jgi:hypothetical protein